MCLNHPQTIAPFLAHGKTVFHETSPWCQKDWGPLPSGIQRKGKCLALGMAPGPNCVLCCCPFPAAAPNHVWTIPPKCYQQ